MHYMDSTRLIKQTAELQYFSQLTPVCIQEFSRGPNVYFHMKYHWYVPLHGLPCSRFYNRGEESVICSLHCRWTIIPARQAR